MAFKADQRLAGQLLQRNVLLLGLEPAMGGQQLQFALGQHRALDMGVFWVMQAQAHIGFM